MSATSRGRPAIAFMTIRSSGTGSGIESEPIRRRRARAIISASNGSAPRLTSRSMPLGWWCRRSTRLRRAKASASRRRGTTPKGRPASTKALQAASSSNTMASTSPVRRGLPRSDAATPPITTPGVFVELSQRRRARMAPISGMRGSGLLTIASLQLGPAPPHDGILGGKPSAIEERRRSHECGEPAGLLSHRHGSKLRTARGAHDAPSACVGSSCGPVERHVQVVQTARNLVNRDRHPRSSRTRPNRVESSRSSRTGRGRWASCPLTPRGARGRESPN